MYKLLLKYSTCYNHEQCLNYGCQSLVPATTCSFPRVAIHDVCSICIVLHSSSSFLSASRSSFTPASGASGLLFSSLPPSVVFLLLAALALGRLFLPSGVYSLCLLQPSGVYSCPRVLVLPSDVKISKGTTLEGFSPFIIITGVVFALVLHQWQR